MPREPLPSPQSLAPGADTSKGLWLLYDGQCPLCDFWCRRARVLRAAGSLHLVDAREPSPLLDEVTALGLDIDQGMVLKADGVLHYGADAMRALSLMSSRSDAFNKLAWLLFSTRLGSRLLYPAGKALRNVVLRLLGVRWIDNLGAAREAQALAPALAPAPSPPPPGAPANADPAELAKFDALASRWWDPKGPFKILRALNGARAPWLESLAGPLAGIRAVDVGCGGGFLADALAERGAEVLGIDLAPKPLAVAASRARSRGFASRFELSAAEALAAREPARADLVCCMEMLEHLPDPASAVAACAALARPGALVAFSTINRTPRARLLAVFAAERVLRLVPKGSHDPGRLIAPAELERWAAEAGLVPVARSGLAYNPLTGAFRLRRSESVNYMIAFRRPL